MATDKVVNVDGLSAQEREYVYAGLCALIKIKERRRDSELNPDVKSIYNTELGRLEALAIRFR